MTSLPNEEQRRQLCEMVAHALIRVRALARNAGHAEIEALADAFHNLPREIHGWGTWNPDSVRGMLASYRVKYGYDFEARFDEIMRGNES